MPKVTTGRPTGRPPKVTGEGISITPRELDDIPEPPDSLNDEGVAMWWQVWRSGGDILTDADYFLILELCQIYEEKEFVRGRLTNGDVPRAYKAPNGNIITHPFVTQLKEARVQMNSLFSALGFSPTDRARLGAIDALSEDPQLKALLESRKAREAERAAQREAVK